MGPVHELATSEEFMAAMGDPRRMRILEILTHQQASATELARVIAESPQTTQYHVKVLERAGLVRLVDKREVRGAVEKFYRAVADQFVLTERIGDAPDLQTAMLDFAAEWMRLGRMEAESSDEPAVLCVGAQGIRCDAPTAKEFSNGPLAQLNRQYQQYDRDEGDIYLLVSALFRIPRDTPLPDKPEVLFAVDEGVAGETESAQQDQ
jgi:DNA-binding transcriptional ArsR family regulator